MLTETALHAFVPWGGDAIERGNYAVADFMDIEGTFRHTDDEPTEDQKDNLHVRKLSVLGDLKHGNTAGEGTTTLDWNVVAVGLLRLIDGCWVSCPGLCGRLCCGNSQQLPECCSQTHAVHVEEGNQLVFIDVADNQPGQNWAVLHKKNIRIYLSYRHRLRGKG